MNSLGHLDNSDAGAHHDVVMLGAGQQLRFGGANNNSAQDGHSNNNNNSNNNNDDNENNNDDSEDSEDDQSRPGWTQKPYNWFYEKAELRRTPSIQDGISYDRERRYRAEGARFILDAGNKMSLHYTTYATGVVYFHRFYMFHSFRVFPRYVTAACCLFLAGKAEETPKKCKDIIKWAKTLLTESQFATFGEDPKEEVLTMERIILQTIRFDLQVEHPYKFLMSYATRFKGNKEKINHILQMAWTFTNDSLSTTICLQWEPEIIAISMIFLSSKIKYEITDWEGRLPSQKHWWDIYVEDLTVEMLEDVCHQVLDIYSKPRNEAPKDSPPMSPLSKRPAPGPAISIWYRFLDRSFGVKKFLLKPWQKVIADQTIFSPQINLLAIPVLGLLNSNSLEQMKDNVRNNYVDIMIANYKIWPAVQMVNFYLVPLNYRVVFASFFSLIWNTYYTWKMGEKTTAAAAMTKEN
ncbi:PREDICTED: cyclin-K-like [Rhagoletis zephyria]|uniref:cyclin-K-like n=1 Tax=Rhagoletis zephyria TaxID=28612 RepID=UPI0008113989|nr:PREDICTED: cyclin-K-like [Rhagoletis zephyria]